MKFSRLSLETIALMVVLILSAVSIPVASAYSSQNGGYTFSSAAATRTGPAWFLEGPTLVTTSFHDPDPSVSTSTYKATPSPVKSVADPPSTTVPPEVNCGFISTLACDSISLGSGGAQTNPNGINAVDSQQLQGYGIVVEPPDQGMCAGNGYVMEVENQGELQVFNSNLMPISSVVALDSLMGLTAKGWSSGGDIFCQYDYSNGGHWIITQIVSATPESAGGPFAGCFAAVPDTCYEGLAVSVTSNPMGSYYVYFVNPEVVNNDPGSNSNPYPSPSDTGVLLNDFAKQGATRDAILLFYDEFNLLGPFNGAQEFAFSKFDLEHGYPGSLVNVAYENMGSAPNLYPIPVNPPFQISPITLADCSASPNPCWYAVIPAQTPDPSQYDNSNGGTGFMVASLDQVVSLATGDNRLAVFDWTGLSALNSPGCFSCGSIQFGGQLLTGAETYYDQGFSCPASQAGVPGLDLEGYPNIFCGLGPQKAGPTPLGDNCVALGLTTDPTVTSCPESGIATNGDFISQAFYSGGVVWTAVNTLVVQNFNFGSSEVHMGAVYWGVDTEFSHGGAPDFTFTSQGYVSASHEDIEFPSMAATRGNVLMAFTLSGNGGPTGADHGGFYPSTAYLMVSGSGFGINNIHIADLGQSPQDGFTEYQFYTTAYGTLTTRPRWGDYSQATFDPTTGKFFFASEFIQAPKCSDSTFLADNTCGGTRVTFANWGSSINSISP